MASSPSALTPAQKSLIRAFFERTDAFFLTGGSALAGYYLDHRTSADLDLFTVQGAVFPHGKRILEDAVRSLGGTAEVVREYPGFAELRATFGDGSLKVDLVHETVAQVRTEKPRFDGAVIDSVEDIAANKFCAIVGRSEIRDYVDLVFLDRAGHDIDEAIRRARDKDAGVEPATLAWILGQVRVRNIPTTLLKPLTVAELQSFVDQLAERLAREAFPRR